MSKKVLIISSSQRKDGNSDILCGEFLKGARAAGHQVVKISLRNKHINYCTGCNYCANNDFTGCAQIDDMDGIIDRMIASDTIVFATPIYFYSISGQMKTFIDRLCAKYTRIVNKEFYYIMTAADTSKDAITFALGEFKGLMVCLENPVEKGYLFAGGVWRPGEVIDTEIMQKAFEAGKNI